MIRALSNNDAMNAAGGSADQGPFNLMAFSGQSAQPGQYDLQQAYGGASVPLSDNASLNPGIFAMSEQKGPERFQTVSPGASLNIGPIGALIAKNYNAASGPDYAETARPLSFGGTANFPIGNADVSYRGIKTGDDPVRHILGLTAPLAGGELAGGIDGNRMNRPDGAYLRWRAQF